MSQKNELRQKDKTNWLLIKLIKHILGIKCVFLLNYFWVDFYMKRALLKEKFSTKTAIFCVSPGGFLRHLLLSARPRCCPKSARRKYAGPGFALRRRASKAAGAV